MERNVVRAVGDKLRRLRVTRVPRQALGLLEALGVTGLRHRHAKTGDLLRAYGRPRPGHRRTFWERRDVPEILERARERYVALARVLHPDAGGDEEQFKLLNAIWQKLRKVAARRGYDL